MATSCSSSADEARAKARVTKMQPPWQRAVAPGEPSHAYFRQTSQLKPLEGTQQWTLGCTHSTPLNPGLG